MDSLGQMTEGTRARIRGVSPVIGVVLMLAIVVAIGAIAATAITDLGQSQTREVAPQAGLYLEYDDGGYVIAHDGGEPLDMSRISLQGVSEYDLDGAETLAANDEMRIQPTADTVRVIWMGADGDQSATLSTHDVRPIDPYSGGAGADDGPTAPSGVSVGTDSFDSPSGDCNDLVTDNGKLVEIDEVYACDLDSVDPVLITDEGGIIGDVSVNNALDIDEGFVDGDLTDVSGEMTFDNATVTGPIAAQSDVEVSHSVLQAPLETPGAVTVETAVVSELDSQSAVSVVDGAVDGDIRSQSGEISLDAAAVEGEVVTDNEVTVQESTVDEAIDAGEGAIAVETATVNGSLSAGSVDVTDGSEVHGTITTPESPVTIADSTLVGDVETDGTIDVDGSQITGTLNSDSWEAIDLTDTTLTGEIQPGPGDTDLTDSSVTGDVYASGQSAIACAGASSIGGTDCGSYAPP